MYMVDYTLNSFNVVSLTHTYIAIFGIERTECVEHRRTLFARSVGCPPASCRQWSPIAKGALDGNAFSATGWSHKCYADLGSIDSTNLAERIVRETWGRRHSRNIIPKKNA